MNNVNIIPHDARIVPIKRACMPVIEDQYDWFYIFSASGSPTHVCVINLKKHLVLQISEHLSSMSKDLTPEHYVEHNCELHYYFTKEFH